MRVIRWLVAGALLGVPGSFAQGEPPIPTRREVTNACGLLSRRAVEEAFGVRFAEGQAQLRIRGADSCSFVGEHGVRR